MRIAGFWGVLGLAALLAACGGDDDGAAAAGGGGSPADPCANEGETRCSGTDVSICSAVAGGLSWNEPTHCPGEQACHDGVCQDPTPQQLQQVTSADAYVDALLAQSGWHQPIDGAALKSQARLEILQGDRSDRAFFGAMRGIHLAHPQGHQGLYDASCNNEMPPQNYTRFGVCGRPLGDDLVVTFAQANNVLGLTAGDVIVRAGDDAGPELLEAAARRPVCGASSPSASHRRTAAAASFFGTVPAGMALEVARVDGSSTISTVPDGVTGPLRSCQDPLGRDIAFNANAYLRPDGIAVVRLPRFYPIDQNLPNNPTQQQIDAFIAAFQQQVVAVFDMVKSAPAIIWDARSNYGGLTLVGLAIVGGMPGAVAMPLSSCRARIEGSQPPAFSSFSYAEYAINVGGPFSYSGAVAVLIDGLDYSAADYFPYAISQATDALLVGTPAAGAYGASGATGQVAGPPELSFTTDPNHCQDAQGVPLEGRAVEPDLFVEYEPDDLAVGIDTVMEAAASALVASK